MPVWEYKDVARDEAELLTEEQLNKAGAAGFELVTVMPLVRTEVVVGKPATRHTVHYFFKRAKAANKG